MQHASRANNKADVDLAPVDPERHPIPFPLGAGLDLRPDRLAGAAADGRLNLRPFPGAGVGFRVGGEFDPHFLIGEAE